MGEGAVLTMIDGATSYNRNVVQKVYDMAKTKEIANIEKSFLLSIFPPQFIIKNTLVQFF